MSASVAESILKHVSAYVFLQKLVGADKVRMRCLEMLGPKTGDKVLDVGCGPAYYLERLPAVEYHGFDTDQGYIEHARRRFGDRATFYCDTFDERSAATMPKFDGVLLLGLLHHLDDAQCHGLLSLIARSLAPGGRVITLDTCFDPSQSVMARFIAASDRGQYVRATRGFEQLAEPHFGRVDGEIIHGSMLLPSTHFAMTLADPRPLAEA